MELFGDSISWHYHYGNDNPGCSKEWVPMIFDNSSIQHLRQVEKDIRGATYLLGYNEPNSGKHHIRVDQVAHDWRIIEGLPVANKGTPAPTWRVGLLWLEEFKSACVGCRYDFVALHHYECNASALEKLIDDAYRIGQRPIWITEFNCGDGGLDAPEEVHMRYMPKALEVLETNPRVARYSWMSMEGTPVKGAALVKDGKLTALGELYRSYSANVASVYV
eukprot:TRINITY_DN15483_c0_g2_i2.p1 TRINITY_DN15483_c0_g2~~TRINITY_DN15483_c0_g2_i2.p1  ORF type:complete len:220 (+),score=34.56 TRINITY_DN15483_c0_g2_i2:114-773(+)